jgi:hypothetical protein
MADVVGRTGDEIGARDWNISTKYLPALESRDLPEPWSLGDAACTAGEWVERLSVTRRIFSDSSGKESSER